jgi:hypothetical protein
MEGERGVPLELSADVAAAASLFDAGANAVETFENGDWALAATI